MRPFLRSLLAVLLLNLGAGLAAAQEPIRLARTPDISPDGKFVAFSYAGDIWIVESNGGTARAVTSHPAHDINPVFSPDGKLLAFSSNRHGSYDVYVVPIQGGRPRRLTDDSATDMVTGWSPDGKQVLFASTRGTAFPPSYELYTVPAEGGMTRRITAAEGKEGVFSPDGAHVAYTRGPGSWYRKGYRGSSNDDVWICDADGSHNRRVTNFNGQDGSPMWSADGQTLYYVSEYHGNIANIVRQAVAPVLEGKGPEAAQPRQVTFHKDDSIRHARISRDGNSIVYECGCDLFVVDTSAGAKPRKLTISAAADDKDNPERVETFTNHATEFVLSGDEKYVAFAVHGKVFSMPVKSRSKATQLTDGPSNDHGVTWAPDSSKIIFISDRGGYEDLYLLEANNPEHPKLVEAHRFKVTQLTRTPEPEIGVQFSPDGKRVGFIRAGKLWTMNPDGSDQKVAVNEVHVIDYEWSPDSKWLVYSRRDGSFASELYIIPAGGPTADNPARNVTHYATDNVGVTWSADGKRIAFLSDRRGTANIYIMDLEKPAAEGFSERPSLSSRVVIDWDDLHHRAHSVVPMVATEAAISPDGSKVAFRDASNSDLWVASTSGGQLTRLTTGRQSPRQIQWSKRKSPLSGYLDLVYFLDGQGEMRLARTTTEAKAGSKEETVATLPFRIKMTIRTDEQFLEMFDQSWRLLAEYFYDEKFHGRDWMAVREKYRPVVKHVALKEDLYALLYLMLGELNASHLGVVGAGRSPDELTADLGLIFDESYPGPGLKIKEVLKSGPADRRGLTLKPGDLITAIDGVELTPTVSLSRLLNGKQDELVILQVSSESKSGKSPTSRRVEIQATSRERIGDLMYDRWVEKNAARVAELSKGKLGYIHIRSMDEQGLDNFVRALYSDNFDKEAIILDVRYNSGGFTHDRVLNYLGAREHTLFRQRGGGQGLVLRSSDRKWTKPLVLLINNRSYSDAEIFPNAFRTLGLGKLVGQATGGFVIGTAPVRLIDDSVFMVPRTGVYTAKGVNMEREGVPPDVLVEPHPDELAHGLDVQLDKAVEVLQADVQAQKKHNADVAAKPDSN